MQSRRRLRIITVQSLYQYYLVETPKDKVLQFKWLNRQLEKEDLEYLNRAVSGVIDNQTKLDQIINECSENWPVERMELLTLIILRFSIFSLQNDEVDGKIVIDEALDLTLAFVGDKAVGFVNGILDKFFQK